MAGIIRLSNTGTGNGQSTITTAASGDTTYTLPSGGGTFVTTGSTQSLTVPFASGTVSAPSITFLGDSNTGLYSPAADTIAFTEGGVESLRIDSSGRVGIGTSSPQSPLQVQGSIYCGSISPSTGGMAAIYNDGNNVSFEAVNASNVAQKRNILLAPYGGSVGIGTQSPAGQLDIVTGTNRGYFDDSAGSLFRLNAVNAANSAYGPLSLNGSTLTFQIGASERARIDSSGRLLVGSTSDIPNPSGVTLNPAGYVNIGNNAGPSGWGFMAFYRSTGYLGGISQNGTTGVAYNTASDYRLKENVTLLTGATNRLKQLPVHRFNFIADPDKTVDGFLAHEVQSIVPEAITGEKDAVDEDGNPVYQGIDQSKLVPLLTAALQEAIGRIETLEAEVAALKAQ